MPATSKHDSSEPPASAALKFVKREVRGAQPEVAPELEPPTSGRENQAKAEPAPRDLTPPRQVTKAGDGPRDPRDGIYEPFSTRLPHGMKRRLKRLSHYREDAGYELCKVQHFVEEALSHWIENQEEP